MKQVYVGSWVLLVMAVFGSVLIGTVTPAALVIYSLLALVLVFALVLWSVIVNTRNLKTE